MPPTKTSFRPPRPVTKSKTTTQTDSLNKTQSQTRLVTTGQSLTVLREFLHVSFGVIMWHRNLLPKANFNFVDLDDIFQAYGLPKRGPSENLPNETAEKLPPVVRINSDYTEQGANIYNALNGGINDAISKGYLKSLMLLVCLDRDSPQDIVEAWFFNFSYSADGVNVDIATDRNPNASASTSMPSSALTPLDARKSTRRAFRKLMQMCRDLEDLPPQKYVDLKIAYNDHTPANYTPPGFRCSTGDSLTMSTISIQDVPEWRQGVTGCTGTHTFSFQMINILDSLPFTILKPDQGGDDDIPSRTIVWDAEVPVHQRRNLDAADSINPFTAVNEELASATTGDYRQPIGQRTESNAVVLLPRGANPDDSLINAGSNRSRDLGIHGTESGRRQLFRPLAGWDSVKDSQATLENGNNPDETLLQDAETIAVLRQGGEVAASTSDHDVARDAASVISAPVTTSSNTVEVKTAKKKISPTHAETSAMFNSVEVKNAKRKTPPTHADTGMVKGASMVASSKAKRATKATEGLAASVIPKSIAKKMKPKATRSDAPSKQGRQPPIAAVKKVKPSIKRSKSVPATVASSEAEIDRSIKCLCQTQISSEHPARNVHCTTCNGVYHSVCIGYLDAGLAPANYRCVKCRFNDVYSDDTGVSAEMEGLAHFRRAIICISKDGGLQNRAKSQGWIGVDDAAMSQIVDRLTHENYIERASPKHNQPQKWIRSNSQSPGFMKYFAPGGEVEEAILGKSASVGDAVYEEEPNEEDKTQNTTDPAPTTWFQEMLAQEEAADAQQQDTRQVVELPHRLERSSRLVEMQDVGYGPGWNDEPAGL